MQLEVEYSIFLMEFEKKILLLYIFMEELTVDNIHHCNQCKKNVWFEYEYRVPAYVMQFVYNSLEWKQEIHEILFLICYINIPRNFSIFKI